MRASAGPHTRAAVTPPRWNYYLGAIANVEHVSRRYVQKLGRSLKNPWEWFGASNFAGNYDGIKIAFELQPGQ